MDNLKDFSRNIFLKFVLINLNNKRDDRFVMTKENYQKY